MTPSELIVKSGSAETRFCLNDIRALTVVGKKKFNFYMGDKIYQVKGDLRFCSLKYLHAFEARRHL
jgi:hypothetical protein